MGRGAPGHKRLLLLALGMPPGRWRRGFCGSVGSSGVIIFIPAWFLADHVSDTCPQRAAHVMIVVFGFGLSSCF